MSKARHMNSSEPLSIRHHHRRHHLPLLKSLNTLFRVQCTRCFWLVTFDFDSSIIHAVEVMHLLGVAVAIGDLTKLPCFDVEATYPIVWAQGESRTLEDIALRIGITVVLLALEHLVAVPAVFRLVLRRNKPHIDGWSLKFHFAILIEESWDKSSVRTTHVTRRITQPIAEAAFQILPNLSAAREDKVGILGFRNAGQTHARVSVLQQSKRSERMLKKTEKSAPKKNTKEGFTPQALTDGKSTSVSVQDTMGKVQANAMQRSLKIRNLKREKTELLEKLKHFEQSSKAGTDNLANFQKQLIELTQTKIALEHSLDIAQERASKLRDNAKLAFNESKVLKQENKKMQSELMEERRANNILAEEMGKIQEEIVRIHESKKSSEKEYESLEVQLKVNQEEFEVERAQWKERHIRTLKKLQRQEQEYEDGANLAHDMASNLLLATDENKKLNSIVKQNESVPEPTFILTQPLYMLSRVVKANVHIYTAIDLSLSAYSHAW
eukprot:1319264-Amorphochlora_amoeboformis.AAC.2